MENNNKKIVDNIIKNKKFNVHKFNHRVEQVTVENLTDRKKIISKKF